MRPRFCSRTSVLFSAVVVTLLWLVGSTTQAQTPVITAQSAGRQVVTVGQNLTLSVTATGATSYQWKRNGLAVAGATAASYAITSAVPVRDGGWYQVVASNGTGSTTSAVVFVNVAVSPANISAWGLTAYGQTTVPMGLSNVVALAGGSYHSLALKLDGTVVAWGTNGSGEATVPTGLTNVVAVAAGGYHSLALKADGTVAAWGYNFFSQTRMPTGLANVVAVAGGRLHSLALKADGTVVAWGNNESGQTTVPAGLTNVVALAGGGDHSLALKADGTVVAWGENGSGQTTVPTGLTNVVALAAGYNHSLALKADGSLVAWGNNLYGNATVPLGLTDVVSLAGGHYFSLALRANGTVVAWGYNFYDQTTVPTGLLGGIGVTAGGYHALVLRSAASDVMPTIATQPASQVAGVGQNVRLFVIPNLGTAPVTYQWRKNAVNISGATTASYTEYAFSAASVGSYDVVVSNYLGSIVSNAATLDLAVSAPVITAISAPRQVVTVGQNLTLSATATGATSYQWKRNGRALADATAATYMIAGAVPVRDSGWYQIVATNGTVSTTSAVVFVAVAVSPANITALGNNDYGQATVPTGLTAVVAVAGGKNHSLALKADGTLVAWGENSFGQTTVPIGLTNVVALAAGDNHSLALKADGTLVAWGENVSGQTTVPTGLTNVVAHAAGYNHSLALKADGRVIAWGSNGGAQTSVPTGLTDIVAIAGGFYTSLALTADGTVVAWGNNDAGQTTVPTWLTDVVAVAAGGFHNLAMKADGTVTAWGWDSYGQTTVPTGLTNVVALAAGDYHSLALKADGTVVGWGSNFYGETKVPAGLTRGLGLAAGNYDSFVLRDASGDLAPTITLHPASQGATVGQNVALSVVATAGTAPLSYQWRRDNVNIAGATGTGYVVTGFSAVSAGTYDVVVSNYLGSVTSNAAILNVIPAGTSAAHAVTRGGYVAGGTVTIMNTLNYPAGTTLTRWQVQLPARWSYASSDGMVATTSPGVGATGLVEWSWSTPPGSPITFSFTLNVPGGTTGVVAFTASPTVLLQGTTVPVQAQPDPLTINPAVGKHSADTDGNGQISLAELTRVIDLYNARTGTLRTGRYLVATIATEDGFVTDVANSTAVLTRHHSADTNRDGRLRLTELTRVIELFNARSGGTRTGAYHVQAGTEDDFAPGT